tara:strand:- start:162 stop:1583 length:1422 start_codon:yes stop_codon:yes gene_type:complete
MGSEDSNNNKTSPNQVDDHLLTKWMRVKDRIRADLGDNIWRNWIKGLDIYSLEHGIVMLRSASSLVTARVNSQYADRLRMYWQAEDQSVRDVKVSHKQHVSVMPEKSNMTAEMSAGMTAGKTAPIAKTYSGDELGGVLDPRMTFDNFIVGKPNELAYAAAMRVAESDVPSFNPLFLHGGVGLGKTHLMHAIAWHIRRRDPSRKVVYLSAEKFMYRFIRALRFRDTMQFKEQFRSVDVLMVDDVQFISGKDSTQEEFFHTFNALIDQNRQIILSADKSPTNLDGMEERLRSRLNWGMVADIHPTTFELRFGILQARAELESIDLPQKVMEYLARKITSNVRELEGSLNRLSAYASLFDVPITIDTVHEVLSDLLRSSSAQISIDAIQREVARYYNIRQTEMHSNRRSRNIVRPRQIAMYLAKNLTNCSYPQIGSKFGDRDHTTVMHAVRKIEDMMTEDRQIADDVVMIRSLLST